MMNNVPAGQGPPGPPPYGGRRQNDYHHQHHHHNSYMSPAANMPYGYHAAPGPQYHAPPPHHMQQWYQPYYPQPYHHPASYGSPHASPQQHHHHRPYHPQQPTVVGHPHAQPFVPATRPSPQAPPPPPSRTPQLDPPTPSTPSHHIISPSTTPTAASATDTPIVASTAPSASQVSSTPPSTSTQPTVFMSFYPELPWYSVAKEHFPPPRRTWRFGQRINVQDQDVSVALPTQLSSSEDHVSAARINKTAVTKEPGAAVLPSRDEDPSNIEKELVQEDVDSEAEPAKDGQEPTTQLAESEPVNTADDIAPVEAPKTALLAGGSSKPHAVKPVVPIVPAVPRAKPPQSKPATPTAPTTAVTPEAIDAQVTDEQLTEADTPTPAPAVDSTTTAESAKLVPGPPKSWAELLRTNAANKTATTQAPVNGVPVNGVSTPKATTLGDALHAYNVEQEHFNIFLEPRGLVNTGNMCYMNSILQILVFCTPFYVFLDDVSKRAAHSFKSATPLVDAMIMFMKEYSVIDKAPSAEQLRLRLNDKDLERYGEPFAPEFVYEVINRLPRFSTMRRGHQQDAEEFLGFLLEGLHDECVSVIKKTGAEAKVPSDSTSDVGSNANSEDTPAGDGWLEVGPKQKAAITRSSGAVSQDSPITKIFGGKLRSEFRVPGVKNSVTYEPYQPLQLDIGSPEISNITQALQGLTRSETIQGEFASSRGPVSSAVKQVFIETLPPILILHLKRFQYDNAGGTQKIWKKIGYPLELEIPKEVFPPNKRAQLALRPTGLPKYRLASVVYHHGKSASGGHYTADIRRQDGREWIRMDDTVIRRVRSEDVASEGGEEDPKVLAAAVESHRRNDSASAKNNNIFQAGFDQADEEGPADDDQGWSQVNGHSSAANKKWTNVANGSGAATPTAGKATPKSGQEKYSIKDNKVAYILFYERVSA